MPSFVIEIKAELLNVASLTPVNDILWKMDIESEAGEVRENITVNPREELELEGSRGLANFVMKWSKQDSHQANIKVVDLKKAAAGMGKGKKAKKDKDASEIDGVYRSSNQWVPIVAMECRGLKPIRVHVGNDFDITSESGALFPAAEAEFEEDSEGLSWTDFDEKLDDCLAINALQVRVVEC